MASDFIDGDDAMEYAGEYATYQLFNQNNPSNFTFTHPGSPDPPPSDPPPDPPGPTDDPPTENEFEAWLLDRWTHMYEIINRAAS